MTKKRQAAPITEEIKKTIIEKALGYEPPKKINPLDAVKDAIAILKVKGATPKEICNFLTENNMTISVNSIKNYIKNNIKKEDETKAKELLTKK